MKNPKKSPEKSRRIRKILKTKDDEIKNQKRIKAEEQRLKYTAHIGKNVAVLIGNFFCECKILDYKDVYGRPRYLVIPTYQHPGIKQVERWIWTSNAILPDEDDQNPFDIE